MSETMLFILFMSVGAACVLAFLRSYPIASSKTSKFRLMKPMSAIDTVTFNIIVYDVMIWTITATAIAAWDGPLWRHLPFLAISVCNIVVAVANMIGMIAWMIFRG